MAFGRVLGRIFVDFCRSGVDFGTPGGSILVPFRGSFATAGRFARRCDDLLKTCKNHVFLQVFSMFALARTLRKSIQNPSERASRASRATDRFRNALFSSLRASKWSPRAPRSALRGVLGPSWALLGRSWAALGPLLGGLRALWGALGAFLRRLGTLLGRSGDALGTLRGVLGASRAILARFLTLPEWILSPLDIDFWVSASCSAKRLGVDFASALRLTCERLASDSQVRRAHCVGRHRSESTQVDPSRRQTDRHTLRSKSSTSLPESQADRQAHVAKQKLDDLTARLSGRSCKRSG